MQFDAFPTPAELEENQSTIIIDNHNLRELFYKAHPHLIGRIMMNLDAFKEWWEKEVSASGWKKAELRKDGNTCFLGLLTIVEDPIELMGE